MLYRILALSFCSFFFLAFAGWVSAGAESDESAIQVVGSGTMFVFSTTVAEAFSGKLGYRTPVVESTGTGVGVSLFCAGDAPYTPDVTNASRPMKPGEWARCRANRVTPVPFMIGHDGIVVAQSKRGVFAHKVLSCSSIFQALSPYQMRNGRLIPNDMARWSQVDASLPDVPIVFYGPSAVSGTRDVFIDLCMRRGAMQIDAFAQLARDCPKEFEKAVSTTREDGPYIELGDNYKLVLEKLNINPQALGIVGYDYYITSKRTIRPLLVDGVMPTQETIQDGTYPLARPLFIYVKKEHLAQKPSLKAYAHFFISESIIGPHGLLTRIGLVPMLDDEYREQIDQLKAL